MKFRFGKISLENYEQLNNELTNLDVLILELEKQIKRLGYYILHLIS